jgi:membrane-associated phospholipid phosphatase
VAALALFIAAFLALWAGLHGVLPAVLRIVESVLAAGVRVLRRRRRFAAWYERGSQRLGPLRSYWPLAAVLAGGFAIAAVTGAVFVELAERVQAGNPGLERLDQAVWHSAPRLRSPGATRLFVLLSVLGTGVALGLLVLIVAAVLVQRGRKRWAAYLLVTAAGSLGLNLGLKALFARARPDAATALWQAHGYAFPSGHAMDSAAVFGALAYLVLRATRSRRIRSACVSLAACLVAAISLSRVYLGVHWISDIVAGVGAGAVWLATTTGAYEMLRRISDQRERSAQAKRGGVPEPPRHGAGC